MKTIHLAIIIGIGIVISTVSGMYVISQPTSSKIVVNPYVGNLGADQSNQDTNKSNTMQQLWNYQVDGQVQNIAVSQDGSYVAAATRIAEGHAEDSTHQGSVYLFDRNGNLLWQYQSTRKMASVSFSGNGEYIIATGYQIAPGPAGMYENPAIYLFDKNGTLLWEKEIAGQVSWRANIAYDGSVISASTPDSVLYLDKHGNLLWQIPYKQIGKPNEGSGSMIFMVSMTPDGSLLTVRTGADVFLLNSEGKILWRYPVQYIYGGGWALVSRDGKYVFASDVASGSEGYAYLIDASTGNLLWKQEVGGPSLSVGMTDDASCIALATNWQVFIFDSKGNKLGQDNVPSSVAMSSNCLFIPAISFAPSGAKISLLDKNGNILSSYPLRDYDGSAISLSGDSRYLASGTQLGQGGNYVSLYEVSLSSIKNQHTVNETTNYNNETMHLAITFPNGESTFNMTVNPGQTIQIPWNLELDKNYTAMNLQMSITSAASIESWIEPIFPFTTINGIPPGNKMITVRPTPNTPYGNYTIQISSKGDTVNQETGWLMQLDNKTLGTITVNVEPHPSGISIKVGQIQDEIQKFCVNNEHGGNFCTAGPIYQKVPITVTSNTTEKVRLSALNMEQGEWVKFLPDTLVAGPNGSSSTMMIAGGEIGALRNPYADKPLVIEAASNTDNVTTIIPVREGIISVLHTPSPIELGKITTNSNGANFGISGVVYDPAGNLSATMPVKLSVLGLFEGNSSAPLPSWLSVGIPNPSFTLNSTTPYYFMTSVTTNDAPLSGTYTIAIDEKVGGQDFVQPEEITLENVMH
ncbi:MAG: PQQ-binding-like beta-propeller repeat protein [Thaumarchaeota archaeon]|nr:PQQ-binding-like beta-propeller repeat protein [Nitrososphaerota archaeon]